VLAGEKQMKSIVLCLVLCACGGTSTEEIFVVQEHVNSPPENGRIENPTNNAGGCGDEIIMVNGQLVSVPTLCNQEIIVDRGDPMKIYTWKSKPHEFFNR
jgi:hypothetical protein